MALINESPSLPKGVYVRTAAAEISRGEVVAIRQPAVVRPYLARQGMPPEVRLIKRVAATGGDAVCSDGRWMIAPMRTVRIHDRDRNGAPLVVAAAPAPASPRMHKAQVLPLAARTPSPLILRLATRGSPTRSSLLKRVEVTGWTRTSRATARLI